MFRLIGNGRIQLDPKKRLPLYKQLDQVLMQESSRCRSCRCRSGRS